MADHIQIMLSKLPEYSILKDGKRQWTQAQKESYTAFVRNYMKRNPEARNAMMNVKRSENNRDWAVDQFSHKFVSMVPVSVYQPGMTPIDEYLKRRTVYRHVSDNKSTIRKLLTLIGLWAIGTAILEWYRRTRKSLQKASRQ